MRHIAAALLACTSLSGCATYTAYATTYGDGASDDAMLTLLVAETATGVATSIGCVIQSIAITETGPSRSPKTVDGDHRKRFIAIGGPAIWP